jgi:GxxExxY protein
MSKFEGEERELLTREIIGAAIDVHRVLGPGLLESAYEECLCHEFGLRSINYSRQVALPLTYKGTTLQCGYYIDILVENTVIVELKAVESVLPVHKAQLLSYMRLSGVSIGLLFNFHESVLRRGIVRMVL